MIDLLGEYAQPFGGFTKGYKVSVCHDYPFEQPALAAFLDNIFHELGKLIKVSVSAKPEVVNIGS